MKKIILILILLITYSDLSAVSNNKETKINLIDNSGKLLLDENNYNSLYNECIENGFISAALNDALIDDIKDELKHGKSLIASNEVKNDNNENQHKNLLAFDFRADKYSDCSTLYRFNDDFDFKSTIIKNTETYKNEQHLIVKNNKPEPVQHKEDNEPMVNFSLNHGSKVSVELYNMLGKSVLELIDNEFFEKGDHKLRIDKDRIPGGAYYVKIKIDNDIINKLIVIT